jgi:hypothetical protein
MHLAPRLSLGMLPRSLQLIHPNRQHDIKRMSRIIRRNLKLLVLYLAPPEGPERRYSQASGSVMMDKSLET